VALELLDTDFDKEIQVKQAQKACSKTCFWSHIIAHAIFSMFPFDSQGKSTIASIKTQSHVTKKTWLLVGHVLKEGESGRGEHFPELASDLTECPHQSAILKE